jgi:hypothetical protein
MIDAPFFTADHPVSLRWTTAGGGEITRPGRLQDVSESAASVMLRQAVDGDEKLAVGEQVRAEAGDPRGDRFAVFRGSVNAVESRLVRIKIDGGIDVQDRRRFRRAHLPFHFTTGILLERDKARYFLAHPIDIGVGGIRFSHRLPLQAGDLFRLLLRLSRDVTISPVGQVIETWEKPTPPTIHSQSKTYVSRALFLGLLPTEQNLIRNYVQWLLRANVHSA